MILGRRALAIPVDLGAASAAPGLVDHAEVATRWAARSRGGIALPGSSLSVTHMAAAAARSRTAGAARRVGGPAGKSRAAAAAAARRLPAGRCECDWRRRWTSGVLDDKSLHFLHNRACLAASKLSPRSACLAAILSKSSLVVCFTPPPTSRPATSARHALSGWTLIFGVAPVRECERKGRP